MKQSKSDTSDAPLRIYMLGRFAVEYAGTDIPQAELGAAGIES